MDGVAQGRGVRLRDAVEHSRIWHPVGVPRPRLPRGKKLLLSLDDVSRVIDVLVLTEVAFYVVIRCDFQGWLYGSEQDRSWTLAKGRAERVRVENPLVRGRILVNDLSERLGEPVSRFVLVVAFPSSCEFKKVPLAGKGFYMGHDSDVGWIVRADVRNRTPKDDEEPPYAASAFDLAASKVDALVDGKLAAGGLRAGDDCPIDGGILRYRQGKFGGFLGCSNYPRCTFTADL